MKIPGLWNGKKRGRQSARKRLTSVRDPDFGEARPGLSLDHKAAGSSRTWRTGLYAAGECRTSCIELSPARLAHM